MLGRVGRAWSETDPVPMEVLDAGGVALLWIIVAVAALEEISVEKALGSDLSRMR